MSQDAFTRAFATFDRALATVDKQGEAFTKSVNALNRELALGSITGAQYNKSLADLQFQASQNTNAFTRLGVQIVKNADGSNNSLATFRNVADAFSRMQDGALKSGLAIQLFGSRNLDMLHGLNQGSAGLDAYDKEMAKIAPGPTKQAQLAALTLTESPWQADGLLRKRQIRGARAVRYPACRSLQRDHRSHCGESRSDNWPRHRYRGQASSDPFRFDPAIARRSDHGRHSFADPRSGHRACNAS